MTPEIDPDELKLYHDYVYRTPEEIKAKELVDKFEHLADDYGTPAPVSMAKECAIIAVEEILNLDVWDWPHNAELSIIFWQNVKKEINKL